MNITQDQIEQTRISLKILTAEIDVFERELAAWEELGKAEKALMGWLTNWCVPMGKPRDTFETWLKAQHAAHEAATGLKVIHLTKLKADKGVMEGLLAEVDRMSLQLPGASKKLIVPGAN